MNDSERRRSNWEKKYHEMPVPQDNPCDHCRIADQCESFCPARARWWDVQMEKIKKEIGGK